MRVGVDIINIQRVEKLLRSYGARFANRILCLEEMPLFTASPHPATHLASRIAAKEACAKALGSGIAKGVSWQDFAILKQNAAPVVRLGGGAKAYLAQHHKPQASLILSISHDAPFAVATAILTPQPQP